jgi:hypothetical protein
VSNRPRCAALDAPEVDDVADQIDGVGVVVLQEVQQRLRPARARGQMQIRNKQGPAAATLVDRLRFAAIPPRCVSDSSRCVDEPKPTLIAVV